MPEPLEHRTAFEGGWLRVDVESWPDAPAYEVIHEHDAAAVLPLTPSGEVVLVRQFRPPIRDTLIEIPAGKLDVDGEDAPTCATRELFEETGFRHQTIEPLGGYYSSAGSTDEYVHLFWARTTAEPQGAPEPGIEVVREPLDRMVSTARNGTVRDAKTAMALLLVGARLSVP